jgi:hypothetical protein
MHEVWGLLLSINNASSLCFLMAVTSWNEVDCCSFISYLTITNSKSFDSHLNGYDNQKRCVKHHNTSIDFWSQYFRNYFLIFKWLIVLKVLVLLLIFREYRSLHFTTEKSTQIFGFTTIINFRNSPWEFEYLYFIPSILSFFCIVSF